MTAWIAQHLHCLARLLRQIRRAPLAHFATTLALGLALSLPAGLYLVLDNLSGVAGHLVSDPKISVYMKPGAAAADIEQLNLLLRQHRLVKSYRFIPRDDGLKELARSTGLGDVAGGLEHNPLPDAFVVVGRVNDPDLLDRLRYQITQMPGVEQAQYDARFVRRLKGIVDVGQRLLLFVSGVMAAGLVVLFGHATRLEMLRRKEEIDLCRLIGATPAWLRRPLLWAGAVQGGLAGLLCWAVLAGFAAFMRAPVGRLADLYGARFALTPLAGGDAAALVAAAAALGWLGAFIAASRAIRRAP